MAIYMNMYWYLKKKKNIAHREKKRTIEVSGLRIHNRKPCYSNSLS